MNLTQAHKALTNRSLQNSVLDLAVDLDTVIPYENTTLSEASIGVMLAAGVLSDRLDDLKKALDTHVQD